MTLRVVRVAGPAWVQDAGREGWQSRGLPAGGPLAPALYLAAEKAVGNRVPAAAVELFGTFTFALSEPRAVSLDGALLELGAGDPVQVSPAPGRRVAYLSVAGGLDVPVVCGARGTLPGASLGGLEGRPLRRDDTLSLGPVSGTSRPVSLARWERCWRDRGGVAVLRYVAGPDRESFPRTVSNVLDTLRFYVDPRSDRVGIRLSGALLERAGDDRGASQPMVAGAVEVSATGEPVVLGPDHPTTGGYPVWGVLLACDLARLGQLAAGTPVQLAPVALAEARAVQRRWRALEQ